VGRYAGPALSPIRLPRARRPHPSDANATLAEVHVDLALAEDDGSGDGLDFLSGLLAGGVIGAGVELSWPRPTRPGDVLRVEGEVQEIIPSRSRPDRGVALMRIVTHNQRDEVVQIFVAKLVVPRRT